LDSTGGSPVDVCFDNVTEFDEHFTFAEHDCRFLLFASGEHVGYLRVDTLYAAS